MQAADELRDAVEAYLDSLPLTPELGSLEEALRYSLDSGGKRVRPVLCLAVAEANGASVEDALPAAAALELVHTFSLVHDDLPALDDDDERRGRPSAHVAFGEGVALLSGDALLSEAYRLALTYDRTDLARHLVEATIGMIAGQYRDITGDTAELEEIHRLKTGRLFVAAVRMGLDVARVPDSDRAAWMAFGEDVGLLFQVVDDLLDAEASTATLGKTAGKDSRQGKSTYVSLLGAQRTRELAQELRAEALAALDGLGTRAARLSALADFVVLRKF